MAGMTTVNELDDLDALRLAPGWQLFSAHVTAEWGPGGTRYTAAVEACAARPDDVLALRTLQQVIVAQREVGMLLRWPEERMAALKAQKEAAAAPMASRRGKWL